MEKDQECLGQSLGYESMIEFRFAPELAIPPGWMLSDSAHLIGVTPGGPTDRLSIGLTSEVDGE